MVQLETRGKGVTLIESMIALLIFMVAALGWISVEANLAKTSGESQLVAQAVYVAQTKIEELRQIPIGDLATSDTPDYFTAEGLMVDEPSLYNVNWTVNEIAGEPIRYQVVVNVTWTITSDLDNGVEINFVRSR